MRCFPQTPIFFGILHCIALASLLALPFVDAPPFAPLAFGVLCLAGPAFSGVDLISTPAFSGGPACPPSRRRAMIFGRCRRGGPSCFWRGAGADRARAPSPRPRGETAGGEGGCAPGFSLSAAGIRWLSTSSTSQSCSASSACSASSRRRRPTESLSARMRGELRQPGRGGEALCEKSCACVVTRAQKQGFWLEMARDRIDAATEDPRRMTSPWPVTRTPNKP